MQTGVWRTQPICTPRYDLRVVDEDDTSRSRKIDGNGWIDADVEGVHDWVDDDVVGVDDW